jgi:penicillin amidase
MPLDQPALLAALRGSQPIDAICAAAGITRAEFLAERDAFLARLAAIGDSRLSGPVGKPVEILRDRAGVPHIFAHSGSDLYFGLGVAMAQDRLWQMDRLRRRSLGRQAEILGPSYVAADIAHLTVGIDAMAEREPALMDGETHALVTAFTAGINRQIAAFGTAPPIEFQLLGYAPAPFTVGDIVAIARGIWWSLNGRIDRIAAAEAARFLPTEALRTAYLTPEASENIVLPPGIGSGPAFAAGSDDATGSNNWAIAGARSATGSPLLAGDPHQPFWVPSSWYEYGLHGPDDHAAGCGHPGMPGLLWGCNGRIGWTLTNNAASARDLYREDVDPADPARYRDGDVWRRFTVREASIPVRGEAGRALTIRSTVRGPIVNDLIPAVTEGGEKPLSLRWVGAEHLDDMRALIALSRARDWPGFRAALRDWSVAIFNFIYADADGNVGYQMAGRVPVRGRVTPGFRDAANPADRWVRKIAFENLPSAYNPKRGYLASANQRIVPPDYAEPIYGAYSQGHRGVRIDEAFAAMPSADRAATIALQNDVKGPRAARMIPHILRHLVSPDTKAVAGALAGWDCGYTLASPGPTVFETFMYVWQRAVLGVHLPARLLDLAHQQTGLAMALLEDPDMAYFERGTQAMVQDVARQTEAHLRATLGDDPAGWTWGRVHIAHWRHPAATPSSADAFDIGPHPVDGGSHTVRNTGGEMPPHTAGSGAEYRIVVDFTDPDAFLAVQNIGNSGVPGSPHYRDQFQPWLDGTYHTVHLRRDRLEQDRASTTLIEPA